MGNGKLKVENEGTQIAMIEMIWYTFFHYRKL